MQEDGCQAIFEWPTEAACGTRNIKTTQPSVGPTPKVLITEPPPPVLPKCVVESSSSHGIFDLRPLMKNKVYHLKDSAGMSYNLSICGLLPKDSCPGDNNPPHASVCQRTNRYGGNEFVSLATLPVS